MAIGISVGTVSAGSAAGAVFAIFVWISAGLLYITLSNASRSQLFHFMRGLIFLLAVQGALSTLAVNSGASSLSKFTFPADAILGGIGSVSIWTSANLAYPAYFGEAVIRSSGMMGAAAWSGGFACLILLLMLVNRRLLIQCGMSRTWWLVAFAFGIATLYYSYSRVSLAIFVVLAGYFLLHRAMSATVPKGGVLAFITASVTLVFTSVFLPWRDFITEQDALRPGSSTTRMASYEGSVDAVSANGWLSLLVGLGDKPAYVEGSFGIGSESTFFSLLVRGGIVAVLLFVAFIAHRLLFAWRRGDMGTMLVILALAIHAIAADLDVGTLTILAALVSGSRLRRPRRIADEAAAHPTVMPSGRA